MPQPGGHVSDEMAGELRAARQDMEAAKEEYERTVWQALEAGGSYRKIADALGINQSTIFRLAQRLGWPSPEVQARWDDYMERFGTRYPDPSLLRPHDRD